jgi:hypothetical protein
MKFFKHLFKVATLLLLPGFMAAQMPNDGLMMARKELCTVLQYSNSQWSEYWEGTLLRSNSNLGNVSNQNLMLMSAYGITDKVNALVALPWIRTNADASYLSGQSGIQDLSLWLKWQALTQKLGKGELRLQTTGGLSAPLTNYPADFMPLSIGLHSKTASLRAILHYAAGNDLYATAQAGHTWRSNVAVDRDSYIYNGELFYTDEAVVPNFLDATFRFGILKPKFQAEILLDHGTGLTGDDIRYNDAPFLTNKMQATSAGVWGKYWFGKLAVSAGVSQVLAGRNAGKSTAWNAGVFYLLKLGGAKS